MPVKTPDKPKLEVVVAPPDARQEFMDLVDSILTRKLGVSLQARFVDNLPDDFPPHHLLNLLEINRQECYATEIDAILAAYTDLTPYQKKHLDLDYLATRACITPNRFAGILSDTLTLCGRDMIEDMKVAIRPLLAKHSLLQAFGDGKEARLERRDWLQAFGDIPVPKNNVIDLSKTTNVAILNEGDRGLPSFESHMLQAQKAIDAVVEEVEDSVDDDDEREGEDDDDG